MSDETSFEDVLVDEDEVYESLLSKTVLRFTKIGNKSGDLHPKPEFEKLTAKKKLVVALLAEKVKVGLDMAEDSWLTPTEMAEATNLKTGTIHPAVRELDERDFIRNNDGNYQIPNVGLSGAKEYLGVAKDV